MHAVLRVFARHCGPNRSKIGPPPYCLRTLATIHTPIAHVHRQSQRPQSPKASGSASEGSGGAGQCWRRSSTASEWSSRSEPLLTEATDRREWWLSFRKWPRLSSVACEGAAARSPTGACGDGGARSAAVPKPASHDRHTCHAHHACTRDTSRTSRMHARHVTHMPLPGGGPPLHRDHLGGERAGTRGRPDHRLPRRVRLSGPAGARAEPAEGPAALPSVRGHGAAE